MCRHYCLIALVASCTIFMLPASADERCVIVSGHLTCKKNPAAANSAELKLYDKDSYWMFNWFDPDDLMGFSNAQQFGEFDIKGCARDVDWLPGLTNPPDPYLQIFHTCNDKQGETKIYNGTLKFSPERNYLGDIVLDS
ncbi:unnamed protein product [Soboliphyme baturini]|uniref:Transthyretin-like family protein n=1 Tax=Soboliphyme baturini TaxID=241478 RepID=A0A183J1D1_9BILA|nr:unnamed protein product [Soboliphyme baturini]